MPSKPKNQPNFRYMLEAVPGLGEFLEQELYLLLEGRRIIADVSRQGDEVTCVTASAEPMLKLRTAQAVYLVEDFEAPRPRALLGDQNFRRLQAQLEAVIASQPRGAFSTFHLAAAGSDTTMMQRLRDSLADTLGLTIADDAGDFLLRIRKAPGAADVWQTLARVTPRPLASRYWRACDMPGALNGTVAFVMARLAAGQSDMLLNLLSGSASIAIEHTLKFPHARALMIDSDDSANACARQNIRAANVERQIAIVKAEAARLPFADGSFTALCADLPFGQQVGNHTINVRLYPKVLREAARVAAPGASFVVITHEIRLFEELMAQNSPWHVERQIPITLRGLHPRIYILRRI